MLCEFIGLRQRKKGGFRSMSFCVRLKSGVLSAYNLDFYSGFIYEMIGIPRELYTPIFAMARIVGWCAHRIEELNFEDRRIIRPAYMNVFGEREYVGIEER